MIRSLVWSRSVDTRASIKVVSTICSLLLITPLAVARPVAMFSSDFASNTLSSSTASSIEWSTAPDVTMLNSGNMASLNGYSFSVRGNLSTNNNLSINSNLNTSGETANQRGFSLDFSVGAEFVLGRLTIKAGHINTDGLKQVFASTLNYRIIDLADSSVVASGSQSFDYAGTEEFFNRVFTLSGILEAGDNYRLEVGMNNLVGGGAFAIFDGITLEAYPEPSSDPTFARRLNFAKYQKVSASVANSTYIADYALDGIVSNFHSWRTGNNSGPHSLEITYPRPITLGSAHLYSGLHMASTNQVWQNFRFQYHDGSGWIDIPGSVVTGNSSPEVNVLFSSPATSNRFRLLGGDSSNRTVRELAMFQPNLDGDGVEQGFPIGTDVVVNLAHQRPTIASTIDGSNYAIKATDGFVDDGSRWLCDAGSPGQTLEIDLLADHAIGSAHLHSGDFASANSPLANFTLEYWDATSSAWLPIPGAAITGNTDMARVIPFGSTVVTSRVRLVVSDASAARVAELQLFPPRSGAYPVGQDIRFEPLPDTAWEDFSDASHRIRVQPNPDRRLGLIDGSAVFTDNSAGTDALHWQLLLNHRDGSYRIRHIATGLCLGLAEVSATPNTPVIGEAYSGLPHQNWFLEFVSPTKFRILNAYSGLALQSFGGSSTLGTPLVVTTPSTSKLQQWDTAQQSHYPKKGIAATSSIPDPPFADPATTWISQIYNNTNHASWSYSWGRQRSDEFPFMGIDHTFNPMQWGNFNFTHGTNAGPLDSIRGDLQSTSKPAHLMGFNEPDKENQGNTAVATAIERWPRLISMEAPLVSPAPATTSTTAGWLFDFYEQAETLGYRVDYTAVHWYAAPDATALISILEEVYEKWQRPVWLTEFSAVRWSGTATWTDADNFNFLAEFLWRAESLPWLHRYSLFNFRENATGPNQDANDPAEAPRSNSIRSDGTLTPFGELYSGWDGVTDVVNDKPYHLHNKSAYRRVQNPASTDLVAAVSPDDSVAGTQWFLVPGSTDENVRIVSIRDGRRLRFYTGTYVGLAAANNTQPQTEWRVVPDQHGWYYIEHPGTNQRLRINGGSLVMGSNGGSSDDYKWRLVVPANSDPIVPDSPALSAQGGAKQISLTWNSVAGATSYSVERFDPVGQTWQSMATGITQTEWTNTGLLSSASHSYRVMASNVLGTSAPSATLTTTTLHPMEALVAWQAEFLASLPGDQQTINADPNQNGVKNLFEYAYAQNPVNPGSNPFTVAPSDSNSIVIEFPWNWRATDITWQVRSGADLSNANAWPVVVAEEMETIRDGDIDRLLLTFPVTNPDNQFFRLEVITSGG